MKQKNYICRTLIHSSTADIEKHKALKANTITSLRNYDKAETEAGATDYSKVSAKKKKEEIIGRAKAADQAFGNDNKALANHEWYMKNKDWKQAYNKEYYEKNKEYWQRRYEELESSANEAMAADRNKPTDTSRTEDLIVERNAAEINYNRAKSEYDNFMKSYRETSTSTFSQPRQKSLIDRGVHAFSSIVKPIAGLLSKLFG